MKPTVTTAGIIRFWAPLSFTWLLMAVEGPTLTAFVARLDAASYNLAAYGVAFAIAMLIESPVVNLLSTSVALAKDRAAEERLRWFMVVINIAVTLGMILVCLPPIFNVITYDLIGLTEEIGWRLHLGLLILIPWPGAIGVRRFYQGLLIRNNQTRNVAYGTAVRLITMALSAILLYVFTDVEGIVLGASGLSIGVVCEAIATRWMARDVVRHYREQELSACQPPPSNRKILQFYAPLAMTSLIGFIATPMLSFFMTHAPDTVSSLAVLPVINSFTFLFRSFGFSFQEVGIAYLGDAPESYPLVRKVGMGITVGTTAAFSLIVFTPLLPVVFGQAFGLSTTLVDFATFPTMLMVVMPATAAMFSLQRSVLIAAHRTTHVTIAALLEVGGIGVVMALAVLLTGWNGAIGAAVAMALGRVIGSGYAGVQAARMRRGTL